MELPKRPRNKLAFLIHDGCRDFFSVQWHMVVSQTANRKRLLLTAHVMSIVSEFEMPLIEYQ
tara:strand:+ start:854 stop:1039 length:186 start_codon:yes stop_codon:yes gene_type:complete